MKRKKRLFNFVATNILFLCCAIASAAESQISVVITGTKSSGAIDLEIKNALKGSVRIWEESNTWGAFCWRVLIFRGSELIVLTPNLNQNFTRNVPASREISENGKFKRTLDINDDKWDRRGKGDILLLSGDKIVVLYDVPVTTDARRDGVWMGVATAAATVK